MDLDQRWTARVVDPLPDRADQVTVIAFCALPLAGALRGGEGGCVPVATKVRLDETKARIELIARVPVDN